jgi:ribonuclease P protein component
MFPRAWRLTRQRDVQKVYRLGASAASSFLFVRALPNRVQQPRITVVIGKKISKKAVVRNRIKRLVRQAVQELKAEQLPVLSKNLDIVLTVHRDPQLPYSLERIKPEVATCLSRLPQK